MNAVLADRFSCAYPGASGNALEEFCIAVGEGEIVGLAGPSGCGKSTLLHAVCGLIPHCLECRVSGELSVFSSPVSDMTVEQLARNVQMVLQRPGATFIAATVEEELSLGIRNFGVPEKEVKRRVDGMLERFGLASSRYRYPHSLSSGERQKVSLLSAMLLEPRLLLLDEPTTNLDPPSTAEFMKVVSSYREERGTTVLLAEHDLVALRQVCDRVVWLGESGGEPGDSGGGGQASAESRAPTAAGPVFVRARGVTCDIDGVRVLEDITFDISGGEVVALVGPNGAGKTTLARVLCGLERSFRGECRVDGLDTAKADLCEVARRAGYVSQDPLVQLFATSCIDEVAFRGKNLGLADPEPPAEALLTRAGLARYRTTHPMNLSVGEQRRLTTVSQLVAPPALLVVDEPTTGLDNDLAESILTLIGAHAASGGAVLLLTHDLPAARAHATRVLALREGRLVHDRAAADFFEDRAAIQAAGLAVEAGRGG